MGGKIGSLNTMLGSMNLLCDPRENAYMFFRYGHNDILQELRTCLQSFGEIKHSHTLPSLCTAVVSPSVAHLRTTITVTCFDYNGMAVKNSDDPVTVMVSDKSGKSIHYSLKDTDKGGTYEITFTPSSPDTYSVEVKIFDRHIQGSPFEIKASEHINPVSILL